MNILLLLIPAALLLGGLGLAAFFWAMRNGQFDDMDGAAERILIDDDDSRPGENVARREHGKKSADHTVKTQR